MNAKVKPPGPVGALVVGNPRTHSLPAPSTGSAPLPLPLHPSSQPLQETCQPL